MRMRFFSDDALETDGESWATIQRSYAAHIEKLRPSLPKEAIRLATDPEVLLADGSIRLFEFAETARQVRLVVVRGVTKISLQFSESDMEPPDLYRLACAIGARYHAGHFGRVLTTIREQEVDRKEDGRFLLRLRLDPFHAVGITFAALAPIELAPHNTDLTTPGKFRLVP